MINANRGETEYSFPLPVNYIKGNRSNLLDFRKQFSILSPESVDWLHSHKPTQIDNKSFNYDAEDKIINSI
jgi:hypothetical protein